MFKVPYTKTPEQIFALCEEVNKFLNEEYDINNDKIVEERSVKIESYMTQTGKALADANYHVQTLLHSEFTAAVETAMKKNYSTSTINKYLDTLTRDYDYLVTYCDRMNKACTHALEFAKGMMYKFGQEIKANMYR